MTIVSPKSGNVVYPVPRRGANIERGVATMRLTRRDDELRGLVRARAPLRLGLAGGGSDLSPFCDLYGGHILNATVAMFAYAILEHSEDNSVNLVAADQMQSIQFEPAIDVHQNGKMALHQAVYRRMMKDFNGGRAIPLKLTTYSDVPAGSGLGSSSTLVVAMVEAFKEFFNLPLGEYEVAQLAHKIERVDAGFIGGKQDQYAATFGGFNFMEFYGGDHVIVNPLRIRRHVVDELEASLVLYNSGVPRDSDGIIRAQASNVEDCNEESVQATRNLKNDATAMKEALLKGDIRRFAEVLEQGWRNKKQTATHVSNPELERIYHSAIESGAYAGKVSGAGGGGFMMFVVDPVKRPAVLQTLQKESGQVMNVRFANQGAISWRLK